MMPWLSLRIWNASTALSGIVDLRTTHSMDQSRFNLQVPKMLEVDPELAKTLEELCGPLADGLHALSEECTKRTGDSHRNFWSTDSERDSSPQIKSPLEGSPTIDSPIIESTIEDSLGISIMDMEDESWIWTWLSACCRKPRTTCLWLKTTRTRRSLQLPKTWSLTREKEARANTDP